MSLLANHGVIGGHRLAPDYVTFNAAVASTNTYNITTLATPTAGNFIIISAGGAQNRTVVTHPSGGWTHLPTVAGGGTGTQHMWYKISDGTEGTSFTIVWSGALSGGWDFMEFDNVDTTSPLSFQIGNTTTAGTSVTLPTYSAMMPGFAFSCLSKTATSSWTPDSGFDDFSGAGEHKHAVKIYSLADLSESLTWSGSTETVLADLIFIKGKLIN